MTIPIHSWKHACCPTIKLHSGLLCHASASILTYLACTMRNFVGPVHRADERERVKKLGATVANIEQLFGAMDPFSEDWDAAVSTILIC